MQQHKCPHDGEVDTVRRLLTAGAVSSSVSGDLRNDVPIYPVCGSVALFLSRLIQEQRLSSVLEFGAGSSSVVIARALAGATRGRLTSVDHQVKFCRDAWNQVEQIPNVDSKLVISRLRPRWMRPGLVYSYVDAHRDIAARGSYDLVFIDGPPGIYGRDAALHLAHRYLSTGAYVVLDDAARGIESTTVRRWLRRYTGLELVLLEPAFGRGLAVFRWSADRRIRFSARSMLGTVHDQVMYGKQRWATTVAQRRGIVRAEELLPSVTAD